MTVSWDNLTPIDEDDQKKKNSANWDNLQPEGSTQNESGQSYHGAVSKDAYIAQNGEIYNTPHESLLDKIGKVLNWVAITPFKAYSQGTKNDESAELEAKEIFHPLSPEEKNRMNSLENAQTPNFGIHQNNYVDENISNLPERALNSVKTGWAQTWENLPSSVEALKAGGIGSVLGGALFGVGGLAKGLVTGNPVGGTLEGIQAGIRLGGGLGAAQKTFELEAGSARQELKQFRDKDGNPLPEDLINKCSIGVGVANSALETIGLAAELKTFPGMDKVFKQTKKDFLKKVVEDETLRGQLLNTAKQLGLSTATEAGTESLQQVSNIVADEYSKSIAGNYDDKLFEDGKINQGALRKHIGEVIQAGVGAIGPSLLIGGLGTATTASKILIQNGVESARAKKLADEMSVDERVDFINDNLDTVDKVAENQLTELEKQNYEKRFFDKALDVHKDENGEVSAEKESQIFSAAKMVGQFLNKFGTKEEKENWFNKLEFTNKPVDALEGGVSMNVDAKDLPAENVPEPLMQKNAAYAGATENETADAVKQWQEKYDVGFNEFIDNGAVRFMPEANSFLIARMPSEKQFAMMKKIINAKNGEVHLELTNGVSDWGRDNNFNKDYEAWSKADKILADIKTYFDGGKISDFKTYYQDKKSLTDLHKDYAERKANKYLDYLGYFQEDQNKNIIGIMKDSNPSTLVHEMGHLFLQGLNEFSTSDKNARETLNQVNEWLGYTDGGYSVEQQEKFAQGFEAYLYNGKAPSSTLREVFENFKEWLRSVYNSLPDLGVKLTPEAQNIFDNIFSEKSEKEKEIDNLVERAKFVGLEKLSDTETRHKDIAYHILSVALGKSPKWLKTILESKSESPRILKQKEKFELSLEHVDDKISASDGFLPEWGEFFRNPLQWGEEDDYQLALEAYSTIVDKTYKQNLEQLGFLDRTEQQYQYLLNQYEHAKDRDIPLAAFWTWIDDVESDFQQTYIDKFNQDTAYIERFEKMDKFDQAKEKILKAYRNIDSHNSVDKYRETVKATMNGLNFLNPVDKAKLTANILDFSELGDLQYHLDSILDVAKTMQDVAYKKRLMDKIHQQLQLTKNIKQNSKTVGKYDYTTNKIFERLRELDNMSAEQANELRLELTDLQEENGLAFGDKIINAFTNYKANGVTYSSTEAVKGLYDDLIKMKIAGKDAKSEIDFENKLNLANETIELVKVLDEKKDAKGLTKWYLQGVANWESMLNGIFDKKIRDKYSLLEPERKAEIWAWQKKKKFEKGVAEIYGKNIKDFDDAIVKNINTEYSFLENVPDVEDPDTFRQVPRKMNKMELILSYMWDKNEVLHERLLNQFGDIELERMFNELTPEDERLGDLMMETVNGFYPLVNEIFIKKYGIDLPRVEHYFPSQIERISDVDLMTDFAMKSTTPSAIKNRSSSAALTQKFDNPVKMLYKHIDSMSRFIYMSEILDKQNRILKNKTLQKIVEEKYGKDVYNEMLKMFMNNAFKQQMQNYSWFENKLDGLVSNWLIGNVAVKPSIAIKQLLSASNYASEMPYVKWQQGFLKACADPVGTYKLMSKIPYLDARFESGGQNEFLKNEISNSKLAKSAKFKEWASANIRLGDVGAIAFGGRPYLEYLMNEKGMSEDEAIKEFLNHTQRTMQASETSTLNNFQISMAKNKYGGKLLTAYQNAQWQYFRMAGDAIVSYVNGDMTGGQMAKTLFMYMFMNPFLYRSATSLSLVTLLATGNGDDLRDDAIGSLFDLNADAIPLFGAIYQYAINIIIAKAEENITGEEVDYFKTPEKTPLIGDIMEHINRISKDDVSLEDYLDFGSYGIQTFFGIPLNAFGCSLAGAGDIAQGNYPKGFLEALGWSKKRAARAVGDDDE